MTKTGRSTGGGDEREVRAPDRSSRRLETFANPNPGRDYEIAFDCPEFTCLCPLTGQPDFARLAITYVPDRLCVELKSLKIYLWSYRGEGAFHEAVTNRILDDLVAATKPRRMEIVGDWFVRGGIATRVSVRWVKPSRGRARGAKIPRSAR